MCIWRKCGQQGKVPFDASIEDMDRLGKNN